MKKPQRKYIDFYMKPIGNYSAVGITSLQAPNKA